MRILAATFALLACGCGPFTQADGGIPKYSYQVVRACPHDRGAFTEGLFYENGFLYESTGLNLQSSLRKLKLRPAKSSRSSIGLRRISAKELSSGLTYKSQVGFIFDFNTFAKKGQFEYLGQGWAFTTDGKQIYMDGSRDLQAEQSDPEIRILDPDRLQETGILKVPAEGTPVKNLNELEWVMGEIHANIWQTCTIARIDPKTGKVVGWIDLTGILSRQDQPGANELAQAVRDQVSEERFMRAGRRAFAQLRVLRASLLLPLPPSLWPGVRLALTANRSRQHHSRVNDPTRSLLLPARKS